MTENSPPPPPASSALEIVPISLEKANAFVEQYHRHNKKVISHKFSIGLENNGELIGVGIASHPIARLLEDGKTLELRRICVKDGYPNACSKIMGRMKQIGMFMGYKRIITYTLQSEPGSSLRAIRAKRVAAAPPRKWERTGRLTQDQAIFHEWKWRWELLDGKEKSEAA